MMNIVAATRRTAGIAALTNRYCRLSA